MTKAIMCTAISPVDGKMKEKSISGWSRHTNKSTHFLSCMMAEAKANGIDDRDKQLQFAVKQKPGVRLLGHNKSVVRKTDSQRTTNEEKFADDNKDMIDNFLYAGR